MGVEIERKFLVAKESWRGLDGGTTYRQGYLAVDAERTVRVRTAGEKGFLTIKGTGTGLTRPEFEFAIPVAEATALLDDLCLKPLIEKVRYRIPHAGLIWEVDEFQGNNRGLILAEVELSHAEEAIVLPDWVGEEVTGDPRYYNSYLVGRPFTAW
ncbi:MAG: CYTH domain-containing protein [Magnetospirillum sp. WYHS-4]